jgi:molybdenum cofactor synthesis domain-containing protein
MSSTACIILIGNEILSGRTPDKNLAWLAKELNEIGIRVTYAQVIPDHTQTIIDTVNASRKAFTYVFTTGGIGPTHDDITSDAIAKAFGVKLECNKEAEAILKRHYGSEKLNAARLKMAFIPEGASLIDNPVSAAPGFRMENVFVLAGVPSIMQAMFGGLKHDLKGGAKVLSKTLSAYVTEGVIAERLTQIQEQCPEVEIGSYPFMRQHRLGTSLVARSTDAIKLEAACRKIKALLLEETQDVAEEDWAA